MNVPYGNWFGRLYLVKWTRRYVPDGASINAIEVIRILTTRIAVINDANIIAANKLHDVHSEYKADRYRGL